MIKGIIYCIENQINHKKYVGKTTLSINKRWSEHVNDSLRERCKSRPLYRAFNKYGIDKFLIFQIEEVDIENLSMRELYWISELGTYCEGYNATQGGDGSILFDYNLIIETYKKGGTIKDTADIIGCCVDTVSNVLKRNNISKNTIEIDYNSSCMNKPVMVHQYDLNNNYITTFNSVADAARWLFENHYVKKLQSGVRSHISDCAKGKLKSSYKFIWKY